MEWAYFRERRFSKIRPPPSLSSHLSSSPMGVFSRTYGISESAWAFERNWVCNTSQSCFIIGGVYHIVCGHLKGTATVLWTIQCPLEFHGNCGILLKHNCEWIWETGPLRAKQQIWQFSTIITWRYQDSLASVLVYKHPSPSFKEIQHQKV